MTIYTLYVKTHRKTGLRYLGQTSKDPFKYTGSGTDWKTHIKEFGNSVDTEILLQTTDKSERNQMGRYYSALWHVVTAADDFGNKLWANRIPETGGGGDQISNNPIAKAKVTFTNSLPKTKLRRSNAMKKALNNPETKNRQRIANKEIVSRPETKEKIKMFGIRNGSYDHTVYSFIHSSGIIETCTQYELRMKYNYITKDCIGKVINGSQRTHKGWTLIK